MRESKMQHQQRQQYVILKMHWYCNSVICYREYYHCI